jgi:FdhE protein
MAHLVGEEHGRRRFLGLGDESLLLSDWSSLHLDVLAADRGLKRLAASLYEFEPARQQ